MCYGDPVGWLAGTLSGVGVPGSAHTRTSSCAQAARCSCSARARDARPVSFPWPTSSYGSLSRRRLRRRQDGEPGARRGRTAARPYRQTARSVGFNTARRRSVSNYSTARSARSSRPAFLSPAWEKFLGRPRTPAPDRLEKRFLPPILPSQDFIAFPAAAIPATGGRAIPAPRCKAGSRPARSWRSTRCSEVTLLRQKAPRLSRTSLA